MSQSESTAAPRQGVLSRFRAEEMVVAILVLLSGVGIAINDFSPQNGFRYWLWMAPIFGVISLIGACSRARQKQQPIGTVVWTQILHWGGLSVAVYLVYLLQSTGRMTNEAAGLVALVALALTSFLAGVHYDWRFCVVGAILAATAAVAAIVEQFLWILLVFVILVFIVGIVWTARRARQAL